MTLMHGPAARHIQNRHGRSVMAFFGGCLLLGVAFTVVGVMWLIDAPDQLRSMVLPSEAEKVTPLAVVMFRYAAMWMD